MSDAAIDRPGSLAIPRRMLGVFGQQILLLAILLLMWEAAGA